MAEGTRSQEQRRTEEAIRQLKESSDRQANSLNELKNLITAMNLKYDQIASKVNSSMAAEPEQSAQNQLRSPSNSEGSIQTRYTKIDFPRFQGEDPSGWIYKCERFFEFNQIDKKAWVKLAVMHLDEKAIQWYQWFEKTQKQLEWKDFSYGLQVRFGPNAFEDAIGELTKLKLHSSVRIYQERFEELANRTTGLTEEFFVSCFVSGLREDVRAGVQMFQPVHITQAIGLARLQEESIETMSRRTRIPLKPLTTNQWVSPIPNSSVSKGVTTTGVRSEPKTNALSTNSQPMTIPIKRLTAREMEERRDKGLCYNCDEKYVRGHRCQKRQLFLLIGEDEEGDEETKNNCEEGSKLVGEDVLISMHALSGCNSFRTMRMQGNVKGRIITILIDSGSTHNFVEPGVVKHGGFEMIETPNLAVSVADGSKLCSTARCKAFSWKMQRFDFTTEVRLLSLGGCDTVLGIQWLSTLGPVVWDFQKLSMQFTYNGVSLTLKGQQDLRVEQVSQPKWEKTLQQTKYGVYAQLCSLGVCNKSPEVEDVIAKFKHLHVELEVMPSSESYEKLVGHCCDSLKAHVALDIVDQMFGAGLTLSLETFHSILYACEESCDYNLVLRIYSMICESNLKPNNETFRIMITLRVKMKDFEGAYSMIKDLEKLNLMPTAIMYNAIMAGYFREKNIQGVLMVLEQMEIADVKPDTQTFSYLIGNCEREEDIVKYFEELKHSGVQITKHILMALINAYATCGQFEKAKQVVLGKGVPVKSLNEIKSVLVSALATHGQISDALNVYEEIKEAECNPEPKSIICLIEHLHSEGQLGRLLQFLEELKDTDYWIDGCCRVILYCVRYKRLSSCVDLLKQLMDKFSDDEVATETIFDEVFSKVAETQPADMQFGLNLLRAIKEQLDVRPSRKSLDFLLGACASSKDLQSSLLIWKEYQIAGLPYNVLSYLRMYQALLASGDPKAATIILNKMPKDDPHVRCVIKACQTTFTKPTSVTVTVKKKKKKEKKKETARK